MELTMLDANTAVNLAALATVSFGKTDEDLTAELRFLGSAFGAESPQCISGEAARRLYEIISGDAQAAEPRLSTLSIPAAFARTKGWFYLKHSDGRKYILAFINAKGSCSMRTFDANTGMFISRQYKTGKYQQQFAEMIQNAKELSVLSQPNLERDCRERLPEELLAHLRDQI